MASIQTCKYCPGMVTNAPWHRECREMALEDLLYRTQKRLHAAGDVSLGIAAEILNETFRSREEIEQEHKKVEMLKLEKDRWKNNFTEAAAKWQKEHPDPDPPTY